MAERLPVKNGIPEKLLPREIVVNNNVYSKEHCKLVVVKYCKVHDEPEPSNTMPPITLKDVDLGRTGNLDDILSVCLKTHYILKQCKWVEYLIPERVINKSKNWEGGVKET